MASSCLDFHSAPGCQKVRKKNFARFTLALMHQCFLVHLLEPQVGERQQLTLTFEFKIKLGDW